MLLGFISLLLTVFQGLIQRTCIPPRWTVHMLPCQREAVGPAKEHVAAAQIVGRIGRRLLSEGGAGAELCQKKVIITLDHENGTVFINLVSFLPKLW